MESQQLHQNLEIKARVLDVDRVRDLANALATDQLGVMRQRDTYFQAQQGRLKLREIKSESDPTQSSAELIWYDRVDNEQTKSSHYRITPIADPKSLCATLTDALGTREIVCKRREVFMHKNVRIHLDEVEDLGHFLELEAVQPDGDELSSAPEGGEFHPAVQLGLVDWLMDQLGITRDQLIAESYVDLIAGNS